MIMCVFKKEKEKRGGGQWWPLYRELYQEIENSWSQWILTLILTNIADACKSMTNQISHEQMDVLTPGTNCIHFMEIWNACRRYTLLS